MRKLIILKCKTGFVPFIVIFILISSLALAEQTTPILASSYTMETIKLESRILNEEREILIYTPADYTPGDSVTVIYLLDGEFSIYRINRMAQEQFDNPVIGIGIVNTNRRRDLLPGKQPDKFLEFIRSELISVVEARFVETSFLIKERILFGHSNAGGFTAYAMVKAPALFHKYIASSPTPVKDLLEAGVYQQLNSKLNSKLKFYISYGSKDKARVKKWCKKLNANLQNLELSKIKWKNEILEGENHNSSSEIALINGLLY